MISRFFMIWIAVTVVVFVWAWLINPPEKTLAKFWMKRAGISAVISLAILGAALALNNISGV